MSFIIRAFLGLLLLGVLLFGFVIGSSELAGETITLQTYGRDGMGRETSLWIVEDRRQLWIRAGQPDAKWLERLRANPRVSLTRKGRTSDYNAVIAPKQRDRINRLMAQKYGWVDQMISLVRDTSVTTPIRLDPIRD